MTLHTIHIDFVAKYAIPTIKPSTRVVSGLLDCREV